MTMENAVREAVRERSGGEPSADYGALASRAIRGARRRARRRVAIAVATVAALMAGGAGLGLARTSERPVTVEPAAPKLVQVPGWASVPAYGHKNGFGRGPWFVANPETGEYHQVPGSVLSVSPDGRHAALWLVDERKVRLWNTVRRSYLGTELPSSTSADASVAVVWSPDGRWLATAHQEAPLGGVRAVWFINIGTGAVIRRALTGAGFTLHRLLAWSTDGEAVLFEAHARAPKLDVAFARVGRDGSHTLITTNWRPKGDNFRGSISQLGRPTELVGEYGKPSRAGTRDLETGQVGEVYQAAIPPMGPFCEFIAETWCGRVDYGTQRVLLEDLRTGRSKPVLTLSGPLWGVLFGPRIAGSKTPSFPLR